MRAILVTLLAACGDDAAVVVDAVVDTVVQPDAAMCHCAHPGTVSDRGAAPAALTEASGIVASRAHAGILYAHNDSGDTARVFAIDAQADLVAELSLTGATNVDWEDIASGPCNGTNCIYVGDIGDNGLVRATKTVYRFVEPNVVAGGPPMVSIDTIEAFPFAYPNGEKHNAETLLVSPTDGAIFVVTKEAIGVPSSVYTFPMPLVPGVEATLTKVATLPFPMGTDPDVSGGDIDPTGAFVLLRLGSAKLFEIEVGAWSAPPPCRLPIANEANGEAISWEALGTGFYTLSEGAGAQLHYTSCL